MGTIKHHSHCNFVPVNAAGDLVQLPSALLKMGSRSDNLCVNVATKYTSYICIHGAAVANLCC